MNPRRSSRARPSQPGAAVSQHSNSSSSLNSLNRAERSTRSNNKPTPPGRSTAQRSQSTEEEEAASKNGVPQTRQRQRGREGTENTEVRLTGDEFDEEEADEEEVTRCICGHQDYPGLPLTSREIANRSSLKVPVKDELARDASAPGSDILSEDSGSLFIQCDSCKVWQHGGCVGILEESMSPDEYFCERCRKDLHKIIVGPHGSKSSHYLPVAGSTSPSPSTSSRDTSKGAKDKKSRSNANSPGTKRRSTMNSRDAAYDEEKLLRRAIEESKDDNKSVTDDSGSRRGKRSRSIGEVNKQGAKRQRTSSQSPSTISKLSAPNSYQPSDDESKAKAVANGNQKKTRTATRSQRDKEAEVVEQESEKEANQETVTRRKSRHERRKGDDAEPSEQASPAKPATAQASLVVPDTPTTQPANTSKQPARKTGRPPARRGRLGRNQYTRDRDLANGDNTTAVSNSPRRGQSRDDGHADSPLGGSANGMQTNGGESGKPSKPRYMNPNRTTMNDMRRRVAAILEFISRMQVEMAASGEQATPPDGNGNGAAARLAEAANSLELVTTTVRAEAEAIDDAERVNGGGAVNTAANTTTPAKVEKPIKREFKDLASVEMMDVLTRELLKWQQEYGKYGDK